MANVDIREGYKDAAWFTANPTLVLKQGQRVNLLQTGTYKLGDGTTQLSALTFLGGGGTVDVNTIGAAINGAITATPNDTDLVMSVESSVAKKNTWTQVKAFLKTYFDTVYTTTASVATQITTALSSYVKKGTLTTNYIPKATASDTIGDSNIIDDGTNIGIGTNSPTSKVHIQSTDSTSSNYALKADNSASSPLLYVRNDGNVGIGTASPSYKLDIRGTGIIQQWSDLSVTGAIASLSNKLMIGSTSNHDLSLLTTGAERLTILTNGDVGISTASPIAKLDVNGSIRSENLTASQIVATDASKNLQSLDVATYPSLTELTYVKSVTSAIQTQLNAKLSSTKERLLFVGGFAGTNLADASTYYSGELHGAVAITTQNTYKFKFNENLTITKAVIMVRQVVNPTNESVSFYLRASGTTDQTITTSMDMSTIGASTSKVFVYSGLNLSVTSGTDYENKVVCPTWATNPTNTVVIIKYYGY